MSSKDFEQIQQKLGQHIQSKLQSLPSPAVRVEQCYTRNQNNVARYIDCVKSIIPKVKSSDESLTTGTQFLLMRTDQCLRNGTSAKECLQQAMRTADDLFKVLEKDLK